MNDDPAAYRPPAPNETPWAEFGPPPGLPPGFDPIQEQAAGWSRASGPGMAMIVLGVVSALLNITGLVLVLVGVGLFGSASGGSSAGPGGGLAPLFLTGFSNVLSATFGLLLNGVSIAGGLCMRRQRSYGLAMAGAITTVIPCGSICCLASLPIGIWALSILSEPQVRASFR